MTMAVLLAGFLLAQGGGAKGKTEGRTEATTGSKAGNTTSAAPGAAKRAARAGDGPRRSPPQTTGGGSEEGGQGASADGSAGAGTGTTASGKNFKSKTYSFGAMDVEGKLKTPQLLYFLNRVKLELDMSAPDTRSFMKELEKSADDKNL